MSRRRGQQPDGPVGRVADEPRSFAKPEEAAGAAAVNSARRGPLEPTHAEAMARIRAVLADDDLREEALKLISEALDVLEAGVPRRRGGRRRTSVAPTSLNGNGG